MRAKKETPESPVKQVAGTMGQLKETEFPAIGEEQQQIIPPFSAVETENQETGAFEIAPGMTVEEMQALFFNDALIEPPYKVFQLNSKGHRYYYKYDDAGNPEFYPSVTTILSQTLPQSPFLIKWIADKGLDEAERYKNERAAYGTFMHAQFEQLIIARSYNLDELKPRLKAYIEKENLPDDFIFYADDLKKDVLAFAQFVIDYDVKPLAVEIALVHPQHKYAGCIDMPCNMQAKPGSKERFNAIVDFKSGRKGFFEEHEIQLHLYRDMWNVNFPDCPIERVFNFSPKDWRKRPTYNLKDQTESPNAAKIPALLELAAIEDEKLNNVFTAVSGEIVLNDDCDLGNNIISLTLSELVKAKAPKAKKEPGKNVSVTAEDLQPAVENGTKTADNGTKSGENGIKSPEMEQTEAKPEPTPEPTPAPEPKKTKVVKRTTKAKTTKKAEIKPAKAKTTAKRAIAPKKAEKPAKATKTAKTTAKKSLLSDEPEI